jgi:hypothetical protein
MRYSVEKTSEASPEKSEPVEKELKVLKQSSFERQPI